MALALLLIAALVLLVFSHRWFPLAVVLAIAAALAALVEVKDKKHVANLTGLPGKEVLGSGGFCRQGHYVICGPLIGWRGGGVMLGAPGDEYRPPRIMFLPADEILNAYVEKAPAHLMDTLRARWRAPLRCRMPLSVLNLPGCEA